MKLDTLLQGHTAQYRHHKYKLQLYIMVWEHTGEAKKTSSLQFTFVSLLMTSDRHTDVLPQVYCINALYFSSLGSSFFFFLFWLPLISLVCSFPADLVAKFTHLVRLGSRFHDKVQWITMAMCALPQLNTTIKATARLCTTSIHTEKMHLSQD